MRTTTQNSKAKRNTKRRSEQTYERASQGRERERQQEKSEPQIHLLLININADESFRHGNTMFVTRIQTITLICQDMAY